MSSTRSGLFFAAISALWLAGCSESTGSSASSGGGGAATTTGGGGSGGVTTTTSSTTTTTGPLVCPEPYTNPPITNGECDLLQQDCPAGQTCEPTDDGKSTFCYKGGGLKGPGKPCLQVQGIQECQAGLFCIGPNGSAFCTRPCCPTDDKPCGGGDCNGEVNFGNVVVYMCSYSEQCTLFQPGDCQNGTKCQFVYTAQGLSVCTLPSDMDQPDGGPCTHVNECPEASICYGNTCHYNCKIDGVGLAVGQGGCPAGQTCNPVYKDYGIGVCQ